MYLNRRAIIAAIMAFIFYWPIMLVGIGYAHGLSWGGGTKTLIEKILIFILKLLYIVPDYLFINALIWAIITYAITIYIIVRKKRSKSI
jgi:hypothetical protein